MNSTFLTSQDASMVLMSLNPSSYMGMDATGRCTGCGLGIPVSAWGCPLHFSPARARCCPRCTPRPEPRTSVATAVWHTRDAPCCAWCTGAGLSLLGDQGELRYRNKSITAEDPPAWGSPGRCGDRALQGRLWQRGGSRGPMPLHALSSPSQQRRRNLKPRSSQGSGWLLLPNPRLPGVTGQFISLTF